MTGDRWQVTHDRWHVTGDTNWPHTPTDSVSPVYKIFTASALWSDSVSKSQCLLVVCLCHHRKTRFPVEWGLLIKELALILTYLETFLGLNGFNNFLRLECFLLCFWVIVNQSTGRVCGCGCWCWWQVTGDRWHASSETWHLTPDTWHVTCGMWHVTCDTWHMAICFPPFCHFWPFLYQCYYPHTLRDSVSPVCGIFY